MQNNIKKQIYQCVNYIYSYVYNQERNNKTKKMKEHKEKHSKLTFHTQKYYYCQYI